MILMVHYGYNREVLEHRQFKGTMDELESLMGMCNPHVLLYDNDVDPELLFYMKSIYNCQEIIK